MAERPLTSLERLRETVALRVQASSLKAVARQVGMSPAGLEKFLAGATPYLRSREKLLEWWEREGAPARPALSAAGVEVAIGALVRDVPPEHRAEAIRTVVESLVRVYQGQPDGVPPWLRELAEGWRPGAGEGEAGEETASGGE